MPRQDGQGPVWGGGPGAGWGRGPCGAGIRMGRGCRYGYGFSSRRFISPKNEMAALDQEEKMLTEELQAVKEEKSALRGQTK